MRNSDKMLFKQTGFDGKVTKIIIVLAQPKGDLKWHALSRRYNQSVT
jgi:hypothetical protein